MIKTKIPSVNEVQPGTLVFRRYDYRVGVVLRVNWCLVEVLLANGKIAKWGFEDFRNAYRILQ